jgi:DNA repair protein SbcC/Rad50
MEGYGCEVAGGRCQLKLVSLQAQNFKKLKLSKPLEFADGIILITGLNESGKSTILDAVLYALFGRVIRPSQKPSNEDIVCYGSGEAQVRLEFDIGEKRYRVVREVHKTRANRAMLYEVSSDGRTRTLATTVNDTTSEIERLLGGITYNEIVASSVVAQKDLERLIKQRLDDRRKVINVFLNLESFNRVQDHLDSERSRIEGTTRNPGQLTLDRQRLETLQEQLKKYEETGDQLVSFQSKISKLKTEQLDLQKRFNDADTLYQTLNEYEKGLKQTESLRREIEDKTRLADNLQQQLSGITAQRSELEKTEAEIGTYADLLEVESSTSQASKVMEKIHRVELEKSQLEEREARLSTQIDEKNKEIAETLPPKEEPEGPSRVWTYLIATAALGAGAILSFILTILALTVALGSLAVVALLLLARQISSLSKQADVSEEQQDQLANRKLVQSWEEDLEQVRQGLARTDDVIQKGQDEILQVLGSIPRYSSSLKELKDPKDLVEQATSLYSRDKQSLSALEERASMLQKRLREEPGLRLQLDRAEDDILHVEKKLKKAPLPTLPAGIAFTPELLEEAGQMRDSLKESVSRVKTQIEDSITRTLELKKFLEENEGIGEKVQAQQKKVLLLEKDLAVVKYSIKGLEQTSESLRNRVKPQVERYMSLILPVVTSGRYKAVQLEEDYTVRVFDPDAGEFRPKEVFSGGTEDQLLLAMRLAFALALIPQAKGRNPEFLFLDEPLGSSDKVRREGILELMHKELSQNFKQIFLISHVGDLEVEADSIIEMDNGTVREIVNRKQVVPQPVEIPA